MSGAPEALFYADALDRCAEVDFDHIFVPAAAVIRRLHAENERLAAMVEAQQPAPSAAAVEHGDGFMEAINEMDELRPFQAAPQPSPTPQADSVTASVAGPMQFGGCPECGSRSCVARECSRTVSHAAQAIPGVQWQCGPQASGFTAPQADSQPAPVSANHADLPPLPDPDMRDVGTTPGGVKEFLRGYATEYARAALAARATADSVTVPAACNNIPGVAEQALAKLKSHIDHVACKHGHWETRHLKDALCDLEWIVRRKLTPTHPGGRQRAG